VSWPIRNQILVPFAALLVAAVTTIAVSSAWLAARRSEQQTVQQLHQWTATLSQSNFPFAPNVLEKMRGLSGAHFIAWGPEGEVDASTVPLDDSIIETLRNMPILDGKSSLQQYPALELDGGRYFAAAVRRADPGAGSLLVLYPERSWRQARWDAAMPPLAVGAGTILLMGMVSAWLAQRMGQRIRSVQRQVAAIADGEFREITLDGRSDEIQELSASVNRMSRQLQALQQTIRQSERSRLLGQIAGGLAHQLRNAVTGARMAVQIHARRCTPSATDESLSVALRQLALTEEQLKGLLSLGRESQRPREACDLNRLVEDVASLVGPLCQHTHVQLTCTLAEHVPIVQGDGETLRGALLNLTLNAIEAAGPGGCVDLSVEGHDGEVRVLICDNGPGPAAKVAGSLFEPFVTSKPEGVGLGLALAKQAAEDHGGSLGWERVSERTRFCLKLPAEANGTNEVDSPQLVQAGTKN
jgi:signal transduction histidine kinase